MWFWRKLNAVWTRLNGWRITIIAAVRMRRVIMSTAVLAAAMVGVLTFRYWDGIRDWVLRADDGQIIVNSPTVYTRQRLVNDRLSQSTWLQKQLVAAENADSEFHSIDQVETRLEGNRAQLAISSQGDVPRQSAGPTQAGDADQARAGVDVKPTTAALFRSKNAFRDEVRAEIMQTQLDDRHDILGNTIYRLSFDTAVLTGSRKNAVAGIKIKLGHYPHRTIKEMGPNPTKDKVDRFDATNLRYSQDYDRLYTDWLRELQKVVPNSVDNLGQSLAVLPFPDPRVRYLFTRFITARICEFMLGRGWRSGDSDPQPLLRQCDPAMHDRTEGDSKLKDAAILLDQYTTHYLKDLANRLDQDFYTKFKRALAEIKTKPVNDKTISDDDKTVSEERDLVRIYCSERLLVDWRFDASRSDYIGSETHENIGSETRDLPALTCPFYDSPARRIMAGILLYNTLYILTMDSHYKSFDNADEIWKQIRKLKKSAAGSARQLAMRSSAPKSVNASQGYPNQPAAARCFAADFMRYSLNSFHRPYANEWERMSHFITLNVTGRELGDCNLAVGPMPDSESVREAIEELKYHLNKSTEAFAYSITPRNLSESTSTSEEVRDDFEMLARLPIGVQARDANSVIEALRQRSRQVQGVFAHPVVVGFGSGRQSVEFISRGEIEKSTTIRRTEFGWLIAPRSHGGDVPEQVDEQYSLTAVISVPSWWSSVELDIETCWISRADLHKLSQKQQGEIAICHEDDGSTKRDWTVLRLPGEIKELSRKLGFEVQKEPL